MDWFPLFNSLRIAVFATAVIFFPGLFAAQRVMRLSPPLIRSAWDVALTLPLVLPPSVLGWLLLQCFGPSHMFGYWARQIFNARLAMSWPSAVLVAALSAFPLMYRVARGTFERFDTDLSDVARTLGRSDAWIFWRVQVPQCRYGLIAAGVLSFARALGEYGATYMVAGYIPGRTATVPTTVYQYWSGGDDASALVWVCVSLFLSAAFLGAVSVLESRQRERGKGGGVL